MPPLYQTRATITDTTTESFFYLLIVPFKVFVLHIKTHCTSLPLSHERNPAGLIKASNKPRNPEPFTHCPVFYFNSTQNPTAEPFYFISKLYQSLKSSVNPRATSTRLDTKPLMHHSASSLSNIYVLLMNGFWRPGVTLLTVYSCVYNLMASEDRFNSSSAH